MSNTPYVLRALSLLGLEEMLKLSEVLNAKQIPRKKAAGSDLVVWDEPDEKKKPKKPAPEPEGKVLSFTKKTVQEIEAIEDPAAMKTSEAEANPNAEKIVPTDLLLWQREVSRDVGAANQKIEARKGYQATSDMYVVKTQTLDGKEKIRFASTNGILVNKKQA